MIFLLANIMLLLLPADASAVGPDWSVATKVQRKMLHAFLCIPRDTKFNTSTACTCVQGHVWSGARRGPGPLRTAHPPPPTPPLFCCRQRPLLQLWVRTAGSR